VAGGFLAKRMLAVRYLGGWILAQRSSSLSEGIKDIFPGFKKSWEFCSIFSAL
jgi:hypothetical protein